MHACIRPANKHQQKAHSMLAWLRQALLLLLHVMKVSTLSRYRYQQRVCALMRIDKIMHTQSLHELVLPNCPQVMISGHHMMYLQTMKPIIASEVRADVHAHK
jgi:hypothetical protein